MSTTFTVSRKEPHHEQVIEYISNLFETNPSDALFMATSIKTIYRRRNVESSVRGSKSSSLSKLKVFRIIKNSHNVVYSVNWQERQISLLKGFTGKYADYEDEIRSIVSDIN